MEQPTYTAGDGSQLNPRDFTLQIDAIRIVERSGQWKRYGGARVVPCFTNRGVADPEKCLEMLKGMLIHASPFVLMCFAVNRQGARPNESPIDVVCWGVHAQRHTADCEFLHTKNLPSLSMLAMLAMRQVPVGGGFVDVSNTMIIPDVLLDPTHPPCFPIEGTELDVFTTRSGPIKVDAFDVKPHPIAKGKSWNISKPGGGVPPAPSGRGKRAPTSKSTDVD